MIRLFATALVLSFAVGSMILANSGPTVIHVDCNAGDDLAGVLDKAQAKKEQPIVIEVSGICETSITINRNDVTIRGDGSAVLRRLVDGASAIVEVRDSRNIELQDLSLEMIVPSVGLIDALRVDNSKLSLSGIEIGGELRFGNTGMSTKNSEVDISSSTIAFPGTGRSIVIDSLSSVRLRDCELSGYFSVYDRSRMELVATNISAGRLSVYHSTLFIDGLVPGVTIGSDVSIHSGSSLDMRGYTVLQESLLIAVQSYLRLDSGQYRFMGAVSIREGSQAFFSCGPNTFEGNVNISAGAQAFFSNGDNTFEGTLSITEGSRAFFSSRSDISEMVVSDFSAAVVHSTNIDSATCDATSDVVCGSATHSTCGSCPESSSAAIAEQPAN